MPAINPSLLLGVRQDVATGGFEPSPYASNNTTPGGIQIICAWPVSGQYGPGTRILYYVLVAACVVARKVDWLKNACIAAALLFPVTAGVHGIVLAAVHVDGAVDMDIYGAFQLCAIGVLVAPISVRLSSTYSNDKGRNVIFVWSGIILAGLLSLVVEFYRTNTRQRCTHNDQGNPMTSPNQFPYELGNFTCGLVCSTDSGPTSLIRTGSANNIYVIPAPTVLTFDTATLLAAACCIPTLLLPASMSIKILRQNQKKRDKARREREAAQAVPSPSSDNLAPIQPLNTLSDAESQHGEQSATDERKLRKIFQKYPLALVFGGVVFAITVLGEMNLFSHQVVYQTDFMQNVGQWAPLVGTGFAIMGSCYLLLAEGMTVERKKMEADRLALEAESTAVEGKPEPSSTMIECAAPSETSDIHNSRTLRYVARVLIRISDYINTLSEDSFENHKTNARAQETYPSIPGEEWRNSNLHRTETHYTARRNSNDSTMSHLSHGSRPRSSTVASDSRPRSRERRSDTVNSGTPTSPLPRNSSESPAVVRTRRDTLDVEQPRRSTNSSLPPAPPVDQRVHTPTSPIAPTIIIHEENH